MRNVVVTLMLVSVAMAGCTSDDPNIVSPDPIPGPSPDLSKKIGHFVISLDATLSQDTAPADAVVGLVIETTNAIGQAMDGNVSWRIDVVGPTSTSLQGDGKEVQETIALAERGTYQITATATAPRFFDGNASTTLVLDPLPLQAEFAVQDATRGDWFTLQANATRGYSDLGYACAWAETPALYLRDPDACATEARWLKQGNQTVAVTVDDGRANLTIEHTVAIAASTPLAMPSSAPDDAEIQDAADEQKAPNLDIDKVWFESDVDRLYVGMTVAGLPHGQSTRGNTYSVTFTPSWNATIGGNVTQFRVIATHPLGDDPTNPTGDRHFRLEAKLGDAWASVQDIVGQVSVDNDMFWWEAPRTAMQAPVADARITGLSAAISGAGDDSASTESAYDLT